MDSYITYLDIKDFGKYQARKTQKSGVEVDGDSRSKPSGRKKLMTKIKLITLSLMAMKLETMRLQKRKIIEKPKNV